MPRTANANPWSGSPQDRRSPQVSSENARTLREGTRDAAANDDLGCRLAHVLWHSGSLDDTPASGHRRCAGQSLRAVRKPHSTTRYNQPPTPRDLRGELRAPCKPSPSTCNSS
ncbi:Os12g0186700 [Oryza sativa Japonica Group]|uniref:Os12g0186700 protein n=1 Tax=Oryza sativa subsp. japonica TaxID=39947 RepID=Q0IPL8_ORYSJ|nr:Os12g0186700 [Oryza sativa Japonica Group]|eukprot:NP_001066328.1 Os12g0186700 [Oryza sativa Japonica Group]